MIIQRCPLDIETNKEVKTRVRKIRGKTLGAAHCRGNILHKHYSSKLLNKQDKLKIVWIK